MAEESKETQILSVYWSDLAPHHRRDALWIFDFDLKEIANAIVEDQTRIIQAWIDSGALRKPKSADVEAWSNEESQFKENEYKENEYKENEYKENEYKENEYKENEYKNNKNENAMNNPLSRLYFHAVIIQPFVIMSPDPLVFTPSEMQPKP